VPPVPYSGVSGLGCFTASQFYKKKNVGGEEAEPDTDGLSTSSCQIGWRTQAAIPPP
jgi:hypothetical protein